METYEGQVKIRYLFGQYRVKVIMVANENNLLKPNHSLIVTLETVWSENYIITMLYPKGKCLAVPNSQLHKNIFVV